MLFRKKKLIVVNAALTVLAWSIMATYMYFLALALGLNAPWDIFFAVIPIVNLLYILPISFSGLGTRDATVVLLLGYIGIAAESAIALSLLALISDYIICSAGFGVWYRNPIKIRENLNIAATD